MEFRNKELVISAKIKNSMVTNLLLKTGRPIAAFLTGLAFILFSFPAAFAGPGSGIESKLSLDIAWERLQYQEQEPDTNLDAKAELDNLVVGIEGVKRWKHLFLGTRLIFPLSRENGREEVTLAGNAYQRSTLEMGWTRISGFAGYPLRTWINPYAGCRWSEVRQDRGNVVIAGTPLTLQSAEAVKSVSLLFGMGGNGNFAPRWNWNYRTELFLPVMVKVTNTALPGFESSDKSGHMVELKGGFDYLLTDALHSGFFLYGGWMHWNGSKWIAFERGQAKWPENYTYYLGAGLNISYKF
jgi:hypothetical protein